MNNLEFEFTKLVKEYKKTIYTVCYSFSSNNEEVADLYQEAMINLWLGFPKFRGESSLKTRVWRISLNTCNNQLRKKNRSVRTIQLSLDIDLYNNEDTKSDRFKTCTK
jgi:RNA polymerase sigma-70 factor (ECF subfamily)